MTGGFAIIASPVTYGDSGILTFILNRQGVVYQKDLGAKTVGLAASINNYNSNDGWTSSRIGLALCSEETGGVCMRIEPVDSHADAIALRARTE